MRTLYKPLDGKWKKERNRNIRATQLYYSRLLIDVDYSSKQSTSTTRETGGETIISQIKLAKWTRLTLKWLQSSDIKASAECSLPFR